MAETLKQKTTRSLLWNALDKVGFQFFAFVIGAITANLLSPEDFGLMGALALFVLLSNLFIESGFSTALICRENATNRQYSGVFYFNILISTLVYLILFLAAPYIALYFRMPALTNLSRFLFLAMIINSLGLVQIIILTKRYAFKTLAWTNMVALLLSGIITVVLALRGYGYWALAWQQVSTVAFRVFLLWICSSWRPVLNPDFSIIRTLFRFSSALLLSSTIGIIAKNVYNIVIGRIYNDRILGYYSQAQKYQGIAGMTIATTLQGVTFPVLSELNAQPERQMLYFRKIIRIAAFLAFPIMFGIYAMTEEFIIIVLSPKWLPMVPYFKILLISSIPYPLYSLMLSLLLVRGRSRLYFWTETTRNLLVLFTLFLYFKGIEWMLWGYFGTMVVGYVMVMINVRKITGYTVVKHIKDVFPYLCISCVMFVIIELIGLTGLHLYLRATIQVLTAILFYFGSLKVLGSKILEDAIELVRRK